jgi:hypothetical protein
MNNEDKTFNLSDLPDPSTLMDNRWAVDKNFASLPEEIEEVEEIPIGSYAHDLKQFDPVEEDDNLPDPLDYFSKLKWTLIWVIILTTISCSILEIVIIKFFFP